MSLRKHFVLLFAAVGAALFALPAASTSAAEPTLSNIQPAGFQRGMEVEATFSGARLADAQELMLYSPGVTVGAIEGAKDNVFKAKLKVAADCRMGIHAVRIRTATGVSNMMTFTVGALPEVAEVEPNSEFATPQPIALNCTVSGIIQAEDVDHFQVELKKGQRLVAEVEGLRLGRTTFDPYLAILNSERFELVRSDDTALLHQDGVCAIVAPEDGKYVVQLRETAYGGSGACVYRLHVGSFPRPMAVYPAGGKPGETVQVKWIGDPAGEFASQVTLPTSGEQNFGLHAQDAGGIAPSANMVRVNYLNNALEAEPNDEPEQATTVVGEAPIALNGIVEKPGDVDHFRFLAKKGQQFDVRVSARKDLRSPLDSVLSLLNAKGSVIGTNDDTGGPDSYLRFNASADGEYFVAIRDHLKNGGPNFVYRVEITPVAPSVTVQLPERTLYVSTTVSVPKGNRMPLIVSAVRNGWAGDLQLELKDLPAGMTYEAAPMPGNRNETIVMFTAAADAAPNGRLTAIGARPIDPAVKVEDKFHQRTMLVRGGNNNEVWGHSADRASVVLTQEVPFKLEMVAPKVPLVQNGSMELKIVATRAADFKGPIAVSLMYNPPGVGSSASAVIAEGKNDVVIPLTCNGNAELKTWKIAVIGRTAFAGANVEAATQLVDLVIGEPSYAMTFGKATCEQGQETVVVVKIEKKHDFVGEAKAELLGLPNETSSTPQTFTKDTEELSFPVKVNTAAKAGKYTQIVCRSTFQLNGEPVTMVLGPAELRVDEPLPPKAAAAAAAKTATPAAAAAKPGDAKPAPAKPLSRLEQLRQQKEKELGQKK